jgi:hypothetical protein
MFNFFKSMLSDVDNQGSSKRFAMLYTLCVIWTFINVIVFLVTKETEIEKNLIFYNFILIASFGGLILLEKVIGRPSIGQAPVPDSQPATEATDKPREDKAEAVK